ncbi:MAG: ACT domain-containing protein [Clostridiales bacterium]|nr:ACT domain-containing protein [Clostridiales bacterium]
MKKILKMKLFENKYGVCRLNKDDEIPQWAKNTDFYSITKTSDELSIVCCQSSIPADIKCERNWRILKIQGPLDFSLIGILSSISSILAERGISIFAISTYDTDYILVKNKDIDDAIEILSNKGHEFII